MTKLALTYFKNQQGFTLVELMVTITITSIVLAFSSPSFYHFYANNRLWLHSQQLSQLLFYTRSEAIKQNNHVVLCASTDGEHCQNDSNWNNYWLIFTDLNHNGQRDNGEPLSKRLNLSHSGVTTRSSRKSPIRFFQHGKSPGSNTTFTFCDARGSEHARGLILSNSGRHRISDKKSSGEDLTC